MAKHKVYFRKYDVKTDEVIEEFTEAFFSIYNAEKRVAELEWEISENKHTDLKYTLKLAELPNVLRKIKKEREIA